MPSILKKPTYLKMVCYVAGMGDILSLVESAEQNIKQDEAELMTKRIMENKFDFNDFLTQSQMMGKMGSMSSVMKMLPGTVNLM